MQEDPTPPKDNIPIPEKVYQLVEYLRYLPEDLINASQLMHRFAVSAEEFNYALALLEGEHD